MIISVGDGHRIAGVLPELDSMLARPLIMLGRIRVHKRDGQHVAEPAVLPERDSAGLRRARDLAWGSKNSFVRLPGSTGLRDDGSTTAGQNLGHVERSEASRRGADGIPRLALSKAEAAEALGVSIDFLEEHVMRELRVVRRGRRRLIPINELQRWLDETAARTLGP